MPSDPLILVTGLPGSGKSTLARWVSSLILVTWISRFITRPLREDWAGILEAQGQENLQISDEEYLRKRNAGELFHPTETQDAAWGKHRRGFPLMETWVRLPGTEALLVVPGPRGALEILKNRPDAIAVCLTAPEELLIQRIIDRGSYWGTGRHVDKIREYKRMYIGKGIEHQFRRKRVPVFDTEETEIESIARLIEARLRVSSLV